MLRRKLVRNHPRWRVPDPLQGEASLVAITAFAAVPLLLLAWLLPRPLILPTLCIIALAGAAIISLYAWRRGTVGDARHVTAWDAAGGLAFIGFAAGIMSNPHHLMAALTG